MDGKMYSVMDNKRLLYCLFIRKGYPLTKETMPCVPKGKYVMAWLQHILSYHNILPLYVKRHYFMQCEKTP